MELKIVDDFSFKKHRNDRSVLFDYPIGPKQASGFFPSLRQMFTAGVWPSGDGVHIEDGRVIDPAIAWVKENVRAGGYRLYGRFEKVIFKKKGDLELLVDGDGVRWGVLFRFGREADAALFKLRFG